ncbi:MAG: acylphosphatase [Gemmatimonadota bacterium]
MNRVRWLVTGMVQGVGFRAFVAREASGLGIVGMVRNLDDGRVEVVAEGDPVSMEQLLRAVQIGPRSAAVTNVENADILVDVTMYNSFNII